MGRGEFGSLHVLDLDLSAAMHILQCANEYVLDLKLIAKTSC